MDAQYTSMGEYPNPITAITENRHAINLWCGVKYLAWQLMFLVLALGAVMDGLLARTAAYIPSPESAPEEYAPDWSVEAWNRFLIGAMSFVLGVSIGMDPIAALGTIALIVAGVVGSIVVIIIGLSIYTWATESDTAQTLRETPGIRRVYGRCPVSFEQPPRWFDERFGFE